MYAKILSFFSHSARVVVWIGGAMMIFCAFMVTIDVVLRKFFGFTFGGTDEISGYLFAIATAWAFPFALLQRANVRIDVLYLRVPRGLQCTFDFIGTILLATFVGLLTWRGFLLLDHTWVNWSRAATPLRTPLVFPIALWWLGWLLFAATILVVIFGAGSALLRRDYTRVHSLAGTLSVQDEIEKQTHSVSKSAFKEN